MFELGYDPQSVQQAVNDQLGIDVKADDYMPTPGTTIPDISDIDTGNNSSDSGVKPIRPNEPPYNPHTPRPEVK